MSDDYQAQKEALINESKQEYKRITDEQEDILDSLKGESETDVIEATVTLADDLTGTARLKLDGYVISRLGELDKTIERVEQGDARMYEVDEVMDEGCQILADVLEGAEYNKELFYSLYEQEGPRAVGRILKNVFEGVEAERQRQQGAVDGFRQK